MGHWALKPDWWEVLLGDGLRSYLINLDRSAERLAFMRRQFDDLGIQFERISAVDGRSLSRDDYADSPLALSEIGCLLSHRAAWERLIESGEHYAAVFEDDCVLSRDLPAVLIGTGWIPCEAAVVKLDTTFGELQLGRLRARAPGGRALRLVLSDSFGSCSYIVHREEAVRLLAATAPFQRPVDMIMFEGIDADHRIYQIDPALAAQTCLMPGPQGQRFETTVQHAPDKKRDVRPAAPPVPRHLKLRREAMRPVLQVHHLLMRRLFPDGPVRKRIAFR